MGVVEQLIKEKLKHRSRRDKKFQIALVDGTKNIQSDLGEGGKFKNETAFTIKGRLQTNIVKQFKKRKEIVSITQGKYDYHRGCMCWNRRQHHEER